MLPDADAARRLYRSGQGSAPRGPLVATPTAPQTSQGTPATPTVCAPNTACGEIGDYGAPAAAKGIPGAGIALVLAGLAAVAVLARSRRR